MGFILLAGGAEFGGRMIDPDRQAIALAGGCDVPISIIAAAAAPDNNQQRTGRKGVDWFQSLGATNVSALPLIDRPSAEDPGIARALAQSRLIYLLGGFPRYLGQTLQGSRGWHAILTAHVNGAVIAGSSAGAMVLCQYYYDPDSARVYAGLDLVKGVCLLPHHDTFGQNWARRLKKMLADTILVGIDEETGAIDDAPGGHWRVFGKGLVTLYHNERKRRFDSLQEFRLNKPA